jgi:photosystem II stability/assembly factor-like uncharacterized protein
MATSCAEDPAPLSYDPVPTTTTVPLAAATSEPIATEPVETTTTVPDGTADAWVDASGNLVGLQSECGNLSFVSGRPGTDQVIAGVALQGLWVTEDGGASWERLGTGEDSAEIRHRLSAVVYDPDDPDTYWESGTYHDPGVYRTDDGGTTFEPLDGAAHSDYVSVDFTDADRATLLSGVHEQQTVVRSTDGGATWIDVSSGLPDNVGHTAGTYVVDAEVHLYGTKPSEDPASAPGIFRTTDGGETWTEAYDSGVAGAPLRASDGNLYWLMHDGEGVIVSDDDGVTWREVGGSDIAHFAVSLIELPDGRFAALSERHILVSEDQGETWEPIGPNLPYDPTGLTYSEAGAFYIWRFDCDVDVTEQPVRANSIMRLDYDPI